MANAKTLRIGLEYGTLFTHLMDPAKVESGRLGDKGEALCGAFCSFVYDSWPATASQVEREMICPRCKQMAGDYQAEARRDGRLF